MHSYPSDKMSIPAILLEIHSFEKNIHGISSLVFPLYIKRKQQLFTAWMFIGLHECIYCMFMYVYICVCMYVRVCVYI